MQQGNDSGVSAEAIVIDVQYRHVEGYHVFTSEDVYGLYVASKDARKAFDGVAPALAALLGRNYEIDAVVEPAVPFAEFLKSRWPKFQDAPERPRPPQILGPQRYVLKQAA